MVEQKMTQEITVISQNTAKHYEVIALKNAERAENWGQTAEAAHWRRIAKKPGAVICALQAAA